MNVRADKVGAYVLTYICLEAHPPSTPSPLLPSQPFHSLSLFLSLSFSLPGTPTGVHLRDFAAGALDGSVVSALRVCPAVRPSICAWERFQSQNQPTDRPTNRPRRTATFFKKIDAI